jgi:hypothetical protein
MSIPRRIKNSIKGMDSGHDGRSCNDDLTRSVETSETDSSKRWCDFGTERAFESASGKVAGEERSRHGN